LDTSAVSAIDAPHKPADELATKKFFQYVKEHTDEYELVREDACHNTCGQRP